MQKLEQAWAAGLFEGEGCITFVGKGAGRFYPRLTLVTTDLDVGERFRRTVGEGAVRKHWTGRSNNLPTWRWDCGSGAAERIMAWMFPLLGYRRQRRWLEVLLVTGTDIRLPAQRRAG